MCISIGRIGISPAIRSHHADHVLKSVRAMFKQELTERTKVNLNELIQEVIAVAKGPIDSNNIVLELI